MAVTKTELKSSFLKDIEESEAYKANVQSIQDWLTGQTQVAQQQYQQTAQTAATQASYDISGAYANYLKQQRNVAAQGQLETGYKEELSDVLKSQYGSAYQQARTKQSESVASAAETYAKNVSQYSETASKAAQSYYESAVKEAETQANIYKAAEKYAGFTEDSQFPLYDLVDGKYQLTDYGFDVMSSKILDPKGGFKTYLEEQGLTDELDYYLSNPQGLHESLFGITDTKYDPLSEASLSRRLSAKSGDVTYIDTIKKPTVDIHWTDYGHLDLGTTASDKIINTAPQVEKYMSQLGISNEDLKQATGYSSAKELLTATAKAIKKAEDGYTLEEIINSSGFNEAFMKTFATSMSFMFKGVNQGNTQQMARDVYNELMNQIADISKQKYLKKE